MLRPLALLAFAAASAAAQTVQPLFDLTPGGSGASGVISQESLALGNTLYFGASNDQVGFELFVSDGTTNGTGLLFDHNPGGIHEAPSPGAGAPRSFVEYQGLVYYFANDGYHGRELWVTDGTPAGTRMVKDIRPFGPGSVEPFNEIVKANGKLYFVADDGVHGDELWESDGTSLGTRLVVDLTPGAGSFDPEQLAAGPGGNGLLFVQGLNSYNDKELWISDGTAAGTHWLADINPGSAASNPAGFTNVGGVVVFQATVQGQGRELWSTDGTTLGTKPLFDFSPGTKSSSPITAQGALINGVLHFRTLINGVQQIAYTNGTPAGTGAIPFVVAGAKYDAKMVALGNDLFFLAELNGLEALHVYSTTTQTGQRLSPWAPADSFSQGLITASGSHVYFTSESAATGREVWISDGTMAGTYELADITPGTGGTGPRRFVARATDGAFFHQSTSALGEELYLATPTGATLVKDINPAVTPYSSTPEELTSFAGTQLFFKAQTSLFGAWHWQPSTGTTLLAETGFPTAEQFVPVIDATGAGVFFQTGYDLWHSLSTPATTAVVAKLAIGSSSTSIPEMVPAAGKLAVVTLVNGFRELWISDGTPAGTQSLGDLDSGETLGEPKHLTAVGQRFVFSGVEASLGTELFVSDGTPAGTGLLKDINPGLSADPTALIAVRGQVAFAALSPSQPGGYDLWKTDGTNAGTQLVATVASQPGDTFTGQQVDWNGVLYFEVQAGANFNIWRSDLTTPGTFPVFSVGTKGLTEWVATDNQLVYAQAGHVFASDGVSVGTNLTLGLNRGFSVAPSDLLRVGNQVYFIARANGQRQICVTDGTPAGTRALASDLIGFPLPGAPWANDPAELTLVNGKLVFVGTQASAAGREVFAYNAPGSHVIDLGLSGSGQTLHATTPKLGTNLTFRGYAAPAGVSLLSYQIGAPQPSKALVDAHSVAWLDPLNSQILSITNTPEWTYQTMLPNTAALAGLKVTCQSWTYTGSLPVETSNGLMLVLGQ